MGISLKSRAQPGIYGLSEPLYKTFLYLAQNWKNDTVHFRKLEQDVFCRLFLCKYLKLS